MVIPPGRGEKDATSLPATGAVLTTSTVTVALAVPPWPSETV